MKCYMLVLRRRPVRVPAETDTNDTPRGGRTILNAALWQVAERSTEGFAQSLAEEGAVSADVYLSRLDNTIVIDAGGLNHSRITYIPTRGSRANRGRKTREEGLRERPARKARLPNGAGGPFLVAGEVGRVRTDSEPLGGRAG